MGNCVEDLRDSDEVARAAYALDRMSASEIAKIISGDKRSEVMKALAAQFTAENVESAAQSMPLVRVVGEIIFEPERFAAFAREVIRPLETDDFIPVHEIGVIYEFNRASATGASSVSTTIVVTKDGKKFQAADTIQSLMKNEFLQHASGYTNNDPKFWFGFGEVGSHLHLLVPKV